MKELICITCPKGCRLKVDDQNGFTVSGNACPRGEVYARNELLHPVRMLTSTVRLHGGSTPRLPVKTDAPLPKEYLFDAMKLLDDVLAVCPVRTGDVLLRHICGTDVNIVAAKSAYPAHLESAANTLCPALSRAN